MTRPLKILLWIVLAGLLLSPSILYAQRDSIWAVDETQRVYEDLRTNPAKFDSSNKTYQSDSVCLFGGRNETVSFQLVIPCGATDVPGTNVWLPRLVRGTDTIQNTSNDAGQYKGRFIEGFLMAAVDIDHRSTEGSWSDARATPEADYLGRAFEWCVPLEVAPKIVVADGDTTQGGAGNTTGRNGAGFRLLKNRNADVLYDIYIPKTQASGTYRGAIRVWTVGASETTFVGVRLRVYDFTLPDTNHTLIFSENGNSTHATRWGATAYDSTYWNTITRHSMQLAHRHRMEFFSDMHRDSVKAHIMGYYTGRLFGSSLYDGPGQGIGQSLYIAALYNCNISQYPTFQPWIAGPYTHSEAGWQNMTTDYYKMFKDSTGGWARVGIEPLDEPGSRISDPRWWASIDTIAAWVRSGATDGNKYTHIFTPAEWMDVTSANKSPAMGYSSSISMWAPHQKTDANWNGAHTRRYTGETAPYKSTEGLREDLAGDALPGLVGTYFAMDQAGYTPVINQADAPLAQARLIPWMLRDYDLDFGYIWSTTAWYLINPWQDIDTYYGPGDGVYLIPGHDAVNTDEDRGFDGMVASIRLKALRRGIQDAEYLWMASQGIGGAVEDTNWYNSAGMWAAFDDYTYPAYHQKNSLPNWATLTGYQVDNVRQIMADSLGDVAADADSVLGIITASPLTAGTVGTAYSLAIGSDGGTGPYSYDISVGSLPGGLSLSAAGILSGTPVASGVFTFTIRVTDDVSATATKAFSLTINVSGTARKGTLPWKHI